VESTIKEVADQFGDKARATILMENFGKHVLELELILRSLPDDGRMLDLGGGVGFNLLCLRRLVPRAQLVLVDRFVEYDGDNCMGSESSAMELLRGANIEIRRADIWPVFTAAYPDGHFQVTTCLNVIEHLPGHPLTQLRELSRITASQGKVIIAGPNAVSFAKRFKLLCGIHPYIDFSEWTSDRYFDHIREYTAREYEELMRKSGISPEQTIRSRAVPKTRARNCYHKRQHAFLSPTAVALSVIALLEALVPPLRHCVYVVGSPMPTNGSSGPSGRN
jgi:SAM-dependent methyltransferase